MSGGLYLLFLLTMFSSILPLKTQEIQNTSVVEKRAVEIVEVKKETTISIVGDILMDSSVRAQIERNGVEYPWEMVSEYFQSDDVTIGNLETSITTRDIPWPDKQFNFKSDPKNLNAMVAAGIDVVSLANNHSLDYGYDGFLDTLRYLDQSGIKSVGGGKNKTEALEGTILERNGVKIGILGFTRVVPDVNWYATSKRAGIVGAYDPHVEEVLKRVKEIKEEVDLLVLSIHWGIELDTIPRKQEMDLAKKLVDAGVDIVMGHHPHVLQGIEIYKGRPIFYSLGNFVFGVKSEITSKTMIAQVKLVDKEIRRVEIIPCTIVRGRPVPDVEMEDRIQYINIISKDFKTTINQNGTIEIR